MFNFHHVANVQLFRKGRRSVVQELELITDARCIVGESPIWDSDNHRLLMVDIQGKRLRSIDWPSGRITDKVLEQQIGFIALGSRGEILGGGEDGVYLLSETSLKPISKPFPIKGERFNDGKVGPDGFLYMGTFSRDRSAAFYRMDCDGNITELFEGVGNSNGLAWEPQRGLMYYNDTPTGRTDCFDFDSGRILSNRREAFCYSSDAGFQTACGLPDGMTIDSDGNLWVALWGGGCVLCIDPVKRKIIEKVSLPVSQPSSCIFAGDDMGTLVITTAAHGVHLREEPLAGSVFALQPGVTGILEHKMQLRG